MSCNRTSIFLVHSTPILLMIHVGCQVASGAFSRPEFLLAQRSCRICRPWHVARWKKMRLWDQPIGTTTTPFWWQNFDRDSVWIILDHWNPGRWAKHMAGKLQQHQHHQPILGWWIVLSENCLLQDLDWSHLESFVWKLGQFCASVVQMHDF